MQFLLTENQFFPGPTKEMLNQRLKNISLKECQMISLPEAPMCLVLALAVATWCHDVINVK
jgi:hypothetical protein